MQIERCSQASQMNEGDLAALAIKKTVNKRSCEHCGQTKPEHGRNRSEQREWASAHAPRSSLFRAMWLCEVSMDFLSNRKRCNTKHW